MPPFQFPDHRQLSQERPVVVTRAPFLTWVSGYPFVCGLGSLAAEPFFFGALLVEFQ
jgi:hypothetical protein